MRGLSLLVFAGAVALGAVSAVESFPGFAPFRADDAAAAGPAGLGPLCRRMPSGGVCRAKEFCAFKLISRQVFGFDNVTAMDCDDLPETGEPVRRFDEAEKVFLRLLFAEATSGCLAAGGAIPSQFLFCRRLFNGWNPILCVCSGGDFCNEFTAAAAESFTTTPCLFPPPSPGLVPEAVPGFNPGGAQVAPQPLDSAVPFPPGPPFRLPPHLEALVGAGAPAAPPGMIPDGLDAGVAQPGLGAGELDPDLAQALGGPSSETWLPPPPVMPFAQNQGLEVPAPPSAVSRGGESRDQPPIVIIQQFFDVKIQAPPFLVPVRVPVQAPPVREEPPQPEPTTDPLLAILGIVAPSALELPPVPPPAAAPEVVPGAEVPSAADLSLESDLLDQDLELTLTVETATPPPEAEETEAAAEETSEAGLGVDASPERFTAEGTPSSTPPGTESTGELAELSDSPRENVNIVVESVEVGREPSMWFYVVVALAIVGVAVAASFVCLFISAQKNAKKAKKAATPAPPTTAPVIYIVPAASDGTGKSNPA